MWDRTCAQSLQASSSRLISWCEELLYQTRQWLGPNNLRAEPLNLRLSLFSATWPRAHHSAQVATWTHDKQIALADRCKRDQVCRKWPCLTAVVGDKSDGQRNADLQFWDAHQDFNPCACSNRGPNDVERIDVWIKVRSDWCMRY